uniref:Uncharacterized protein n=1 Tax=Oryza nivara TaxID=4536 RepID=A0A0E0G2X1_ORYNI
MGLLIILGRTEKCRYEEAGGASEVRTSFMPPAVFIAVLIAEEQQEAAMLGEAPFQSKVPADDNKVGRLMHPENCKAVRGEKER